MICPKCKNEIDTIIIKSQVIHLDSNGKAELSRQCPICDEIIDYWTVQIHDNWEAQE